MPAVGIDLVEGIFESDVELRDIEPDSAPESEFPVAARCADFAQIDFRIEVGCKSVAVIAAVTVENINGVNLVKFVLLAFCASLGNAVRITSMMTIMINTNTFIKIKNRLSRNFNDSRSNIYHSWPY